MLTGHGMVGSPCVGITFNEQQITITKLNEPSAFFLLLFVFTASLVQSALSA